MPVNSTTKSADAPKLSAQSEANSDGAYFCESPTEAEAFLQLHFPQTLVDFKRQYAIEGKIISGVFGATRIKMYSQEDVVEFLRSAIDCGISEESAMAIFKKELLGNDVPHYRFNELITFFHKCRYLVLGPEGKEISRSLASFLLSENVDVSLDYKLEVALTVLKYPNPEVIFAVLERDFASFAMTASNNYMDYAVSEILEYAFKNENSPKELTAILKASARLLDLLKSKGVQCDFQFIARYSADEINELQKLIMSPSVGKTDALELSFFKVVKLFKEAGFKIDKRLLFDVKALESALGYGFVFKGLKKIIRSAGPLNAAKVLDELGMSPDLFKKLCLNLDGARSKKGVVLVVDSGNNFDSLNLSRLLEEHDVILLDNPNKANSYLSPADLNDLRFKTALMDEAKDPSSLDAHEKKMRALTLGKLARWLTAGLKNDKKLKMNKDFLAFTNFVAKGRSLHDLIEAHYIAVKSMFVFYPTEEEVLNIAYGIRHLGKDKAIEMHKKTGMVFFGRYRPADLHKLYTHMNPDSPECAGKPVLLRVTTTIDDNGAEYDTGIIAEGNSQELFERFRVIVVETPLPERELLQYLEVLLPEGQLIDKFIGSAHGSEESAVYSKARRGYYGAEDEMILDGGDLAFFRRLSARLKDRAEFYMVTCSAGKGSKSLAWYASRGMPHVTVYAPIHPTGVRIYFSSEGELVVSYLDAWARSFRGGRSAKM